MASRPEVFCKIVSLAFAAPWNFCTHDHNVVRPTTYKVSFLGGRVPLDLRFRGPLEVKSFVRGPKIEPPGAPGRVLDLKCASCGHVRRCSAHFFLLAAVSVTNLLVIVVQLKFAVNSAAMPTLTACNHSGLKIGA